MLSVNESAQNDTGFNTVGQDPKSAESPHSPGHAATAPWRVVRVDSLRLKKILLSKIPFDPFQRDQQNGIEASLIHMIAIPFFRSIQRGAGIDP